MWNYRKINFICRIVTDENGKFKFDLMLRTDVIITDGKTYNNFTEASNALNEYLNKMYDYEKNFNSSNKQTHLVINETI